MTASGDDQPTRKCWRLVPVPVVTGVPAVIGAVVLAVFLSGCRGAPIQWRRVRVSIRLGHVSQHVASTDSKHQQKRLEDPSGCARRI
jgi:hypothetical protein